MHGNENTLALNVLAWSHIHWNEMAENSSLFYVLVHIQLTFFLQSLLYYKTSTYNRKRLIVLYLLCICVFLLIIILTPMKFMSLTSLN